jgi:hypothetical protein
MNAPKAVGTAWMDEPRASQRGAVVPGLRSERWGASAQARRDGAAMKGDTGRQAGAPEASGRTQ